LLGQVQHGLMISMRRERESMKTGTTKFRGLDAVHLRAADGASAIVTTYGAHVLSWIPAGGDERLFLSSKSAMDRSAPIRGGVPVIFPQFATYGPLPHHGLVRTRDWHITAVDLDNESAHARFRIEDCSETRQRWPHAFRCELVVTVGGDQLELQLRIENPEPAPFTFCAALHTYVRVADIRSVRLVGLSGSRYRDRTNNDRAVEDEAEELSVTGEVDRVYVGAPKSLVLREPEHCLNIDAEGFPDVVIWNPWEARCNLLADMPRDAYLHMLSVEAAAIVRPLTLAQGDHWVGAQTLTCAQ
jgi:glucose-6-phosphate 1-epimerase